MAYRMWYSKGEVLYMSLNDEETAPTIQLRVFGKSTGRPSIEKAFDSENKS